MRGFTGAGVAILAVAGALVAALPSAGQDSKTTPSASLTFMCVDPYKDVAIMRLKNPGKDREYSWVDFGTAQEGGGKAPEKTDTYFYVNGANRGHTVVLKIGDQRLTKATNTTNKCQSAVTTTKAVEGADAPGGTWPFELKGTSGASERIFDGQFELGDGESNSQKVPGTIEKGSFPIDSPYPGGYSYHVREVDARGATVEATNTDFVASKDGKNVASFVNRYPDAPIPTPTPTPEPTPPPEPGPGPEPGPQPVPVAPGPGTIDLAVTKDVSPARARTGEVFTFTVTATNLGPATATNVVGAESAKTDQTRVPVDILELETSPGVTCNGVRPLICRKATLAPGESASIRVRTRQNAVGVLQNFAEVRADQPENNYSNNEDVAGIVVKPVPAAIRIVKRADRGRVRAGQTVTYINTIRSTGRYEAVNVQVCDRLPSGLAYRRAPSAVFSRGRACWFYPYLAPGERRRLAIRTRALNPTGSTVTVVNRSVVRAKRTRPRAAESRVRVQGRSRGGGVTG